MFFNKKMTLDEFVAGLRTAWGNRLLSLVLYGSAARGEFSEDSDYNLLAVVEDDAPAALKPALPLVGRWVRDGHPSPAIFTPAKIAASSDVLPMEFLDIRDHRKVLYGPDPLAGLAVDPRNLRHQVENELSENIQRLRRFYIASDGKAGTLLGLMSRALPTVQVLFRHVLRLHGGTPPAQKQESAPVLSKTLSLDLSVFDRVAAFQGARGRMTNEGMEELFTAYLSALDRVAAAVDSLPV